MSIRANVEHAGTQRGFAFSDRPRRARRDLVRDDKGQWWQAVAAIVNGTVVCRVVPVPSRNSRRVARLRLAGGGEP